jgi:hypothetical protein
MNYRKTYLLVIKNARKQNRKSGFGKYYENHHILPKSLFPLWRDRKSNLVLLTPREHFFCHQLLTKIYSNNKMMYALWRLINGLNVKYCSSKEYERIRIKYIKEVCENNSWGTKNKGRKRSEEERLLISKKTKEAMKKVDKKLISPHIGHHWYTNGIENKLCFDCPEGWRSGRSGVNWTDGFKGAQKYWENNPEIRPKFSHEKALKSWETKRKNGTCHTTKGMKITRKVH